MSTFNFADIVLTALKQYKLACIVIIVRSLEWFQVMENIFCNVKSTWMFIWPVTLHIDILDKNIRPLENKVHL